MRVVFILPDDLATTPVPWSARNPPMVRLGPAIVAADPTPSAGDDSPLHWHRLEVAMGHAVQLAENVKMRKKKEKMEKDEKKETKGRDNQYSPCFCEGVET